jgi:alpha-L-rhamnosidase
LLIHTQNGWTSLCHPWASGALQWLSYVGLGVTPLAPAFRVARIQPALAVVDGKMPTPHGAITVSQRADEGRLNVTLPSGVTAVLSLMLLADANSVRLVTLNGKKLTDSDWTLTKHEDRVWLTLTAPVGPGAHVLLATVASAQGALQAPREEDVMKTVAFPGGNMLKLPLGPYSPPTYAASLVGEDRVTRGNWQGRYGKLGYALFAASGGQDVLSLPAFAASIGHTSPTPFNHVDATDERALQLPSGGRGLGSGLGGGIQYVNYVDVLVQQSAENKPYLLSAYFCDFDCPTCPSPSAEVGQARSMGVVAYDFYTRETIAPVALLANFSQGVWLTWRVSTSLRLRFPQVAGDNPVLSALMFDSV